MNKENHLVYSYEWKEEKIVLWSHKDKRWLSQWEYTFKNEKMLDYFLITRPCAIYLDLKY